MGGLDFSPIFIFIVIGLIQNLLYRLLESVNRLLLLLLAFNPIGPANDRHETCSCP